MRSEKPLVVVLDSALQSAALWMREASDFDGPDVLEPLPLPPDAPFPDPLPFAIVWLLSGEERSELKALRLHNHGTLGEAEMLLRHKGIVNLVR